MALPVGLIPTFAFVMTVGIPVTVALSAHLYNRSQEGAMRDALRVAVIEAALLYTVGIYVIWSIAGGGSLWGLVAALAVVGVFCLIFLLAVPLLVGQWLVEHVRDVPSDTALKAVVTGWPPAMLLVFGIFIAPGGLTAGHLFDIEGPQTCLAGHCGIAIGLLAVTALEGLIATFGPGVAGLLFTTHTTKSA
ncbi:hypothetical protein C454_18099 [Haloferax gibbonsii ATCC 33959]|uniref:Uncharacterized protein n=1 Tax=Haloferax gibbonsii (strain ATCC 33959 / DSM 4427 / JCM 8863 / NBRC 102184 / NCIMB 2188 / Ma 2.38) TaxID=1227459 RepID=M0GVI0_HALGM|nr:hypothetical protein [Haloferax gibbonsii]ELZ76235.1 hypothetical protein C454_18099 [Haloferax gibbonsii ATCC 33959]